jgi:hypothetical protein
MQVLERYLKIRPRLIIAYSLTIKKVKQSRLHYMEELWERGGI